MEIIPKDQEPTIRDVLETINIFSGHIDQEFADLKTHATHVDEELSDLKARTKRIENTMATKEYIDDKLFDLKGDMATMVQKEDKKIMTLVHILESRQVITHEEVDKVLS